MSQAIRTEPMQPTDADLARFKRCFDENNSVPRSVSLLDWQYRRPPAAAILVDFAVDGSVESPAENTEVAGIYAVFPVRFKIGAEERIGVQSLDTLTDHRYRGKGIFTSLARSLYDR